MAAPLRRASYMMKGRSVVGSLSIARSSSSDRLLKSLANPRP